MSTCVAMTKEEIIQCVKDCGQSLIDNAEKIVGDYKYSTDLSIYCRVDKEDKAPYIEVTREFIPEKFIERLIMR
jgi:hypothetical protein